MGNTQRQARALVDRILGLSLWGSSPFFLLDVGCSGGLDQRWFTFSDRLRAVGFDPLVTEIERLTTLNTQSGVVYEAAYVVGGEEDGLSPGPRTDELDARSNQSFMRTSAIAAARQMKTSYTQQIFNSGAPVVLTERRVTLDNYVSTTEYADVDFLKVDTDGHDIEVILGASNIMAASGLLGLQVEVQFHGSLHEHANTFSSIDRLLRGRGFSLFDLDVYRYSRAHLPAPFVYDIPAQTTSGQVSWGEALYLRDVVSPRYEDVWKYEITPERVMKLVSLFDLFDLPDCAAELLRERADFLDASVRESLLDLLVSGEPGAYKALLTGFEQDFTSFYPSRRTAGGTPEAMVDGSVPQASDDGVDGSAQEPQVVRELEKRVAMLRTRNAVLRNRLADRSERLRRLSRRLEELKDKA